MREIWRSGVLASCQKKDYCWYSTRPRVLVIALLWSQTAGSHGGKVLCPQKNIEGRGWGREQKLGPASIELNTSSCVEVFPPSLETDFAVWVHMKSSKINGPGVPTFHIHFPKSGFSSGNPTDSDSYVTAKFQCCPWVTGQPQRLNSSLGRLDVWKGGRHQPDTLFP